MKSAPVVIPFYFPPPNPESYRESEEWTGLPADLYNDETLSDFIHLLN